MMLKRDDQASDQRYTVDGVLVKRGDIVWRSDQYVCVVRQRKLDKIDLGMWWDRMRKEIFSTEIAALAGQLELQKKNLAKAKKRGTASIQEHRTAERKAGGGQEVRMTNATNQPEVDVVSGAALTEDIESSAITALHRMAACSAHLSYPEDVIAAYVAGRVARGKQVTSEALRDLGARYLALLVELAKQVDARMSVERDLADERATKAACECWRGLGECRVCFERRAVVSP